MADDDTDPLETDDGNAALFQKRQIGVNELAAETARDADDAGEAQSQENLGGTKEEAEPKVVPKVDPAANDTSKPKQVTPETLLEHRGEGYFRLALIGYPGTGKTCFLNRLKYEITRREETDKKGQYRIEPSLPAKLIPQTAGVEWHGFWWSASTESDPVESGSDENGGADFARSFVVYDLAGEALSKPELEARAHEILADSDAIIIVLPSDVVLAAADPAWKYVARVRDHLDERIAGLTSPAAPVDAARNGGDPQPGADQAASPNRVAQAIESNRQAELEGKLRSLRLDVARLEALNADATQLKSLKSRLIDDRDGIEQFLDRLGAMIAVSGAMRNAGLDYGPFQALPDAERRRHGRWVRPPLAYIAISKTDGLLSDEPPIVPLEEKLVQAFWRDAASGSDALPKLGEPDWSRHEREARARLDEDPERTVTLACVSLRTVVRKTFARHKIDFLTSFDGLQKASALSPLVAGEKYSENINYQVDCYGVTAVIDWIGYARKRRQTRGWRHVFEIPAKLEAAVQKLRPPFGLPRKLVGGSAALTAMLVGLGLAYLWPPSRPYLLLLLLAALLLPSALVLARIVQWAAVKVEWVEFAFARGKGATWAGFLAAGTFLYLIGDVASDQLSGLSRAETLASRPGEARELRQLRSRYPAEAAYLHVPGLFQNGRLSESVQPWSSVPPTGGYFGVPAGPVRDRYEAVLATIRQWRATGPIEPSQAATVADQLAGLQDTIVAARAGQLDADIDRRSFSYYHLGLAQLRSGQWQEAIGQFDALRKLIETTEPPTTPQARRRAQGVGIALRHAKGVALLKLGQSGDAKRQLTDARAMVTDGRDWLTPDAAALHILEPDERVTPARFSTLDIDTDLLAASLRTFESKRDLADDSEFRRLVEDMGTRATGITPGHPLQTNLTLAEALLGQPLSITPDLDGPLPVPDRDEVEDARNSLEGSGDWEEADKVRRAFEEGRPDDIAGLFSDDNPTAETDRARQRLLARRVAREILDDLRAKKRLEKRSEDLSPYVGKVPGFAATDLAEDMAGGWWWYWLRKILPWLPVALAFAVLLLVLLRTLETNAQQTSARHHADRMKAATAREAAAAEA